MVERSICVMTSRTASLIHRWLDKIEDKKKKMSVVYDGRETHWAFRVLLATVL